MTDQCLKARAPDGTPETLLVMPDEREARARLKTRQSIHDWCKNGRTVGWQNARRSFVNPAAQLDERNRPLPGLNHAVVQFGDGCVRGSG